MVVPLVEESRVEHEGMHFWLSFTCFSKDSHDGSFHDEVMLELHSVLCSLYMSHSPFVYEENATRERTEFLEAPPSSFM